MDNDLMARRLRPPSQPSSGQPAQPSSPWDVPLTDEGQFAAPDPAARADVPWDRPAAEPWPPTDDFGPGADMLQTWSAQTGGPDAVARPEWPTADPLGDATPPWDRPAASSGAQWQDPEDAFAPVVGDLAASGGAWASWNGNGNGYSNGNGNGHYSKAGTPEPMKVSAHADQPIRGDEPHSAGSDPLPEWPAEDDLTVAPPSGRGPVMPEVSWPVTPPPPPAPPVAAQPPAPVWPPPQPPQPEPDQYRPAPEPAAPVPAAPVPTAPKVEVSTPPNTHIVAMTPSGTPQNMVLRIELAIVDESHRANPADAAKRVGPDADVRRPEYGPRNHGGRDPVPEPEYLWGAPPPDAQNQQPQRRPRQAQQPQMPPAPPQHLAPPPSSWLPAAQPPQPQNMDWDLPQVASNQPHSDPPAPWSSPQHEPPQASYAPAPTWAMTQPTPPYQPEPPQYMPPPAPQHQQSQWPQAQAPQAQAPQYQQPYQQPGYQPAPQAAWPPQQHDPQPAWPAAPQHQAPRGQAMVQSAPAAGSRARTGGVAADQADLWFLNQPATSAVAEGDTHGEGKSSSILTAGLTIGFALLVIVLVLVFIQLMTSILR